MSNLEKEIKELSCPGCKKTIRVSYYDIFTHKEAKCTHCKSSYKFGSSEASNLHLSIRNMENAKEKLDESFEKIINKAEKRTFNTR